MVFGGVFGARGAGHRLQRQGDPGHQPRHGVPGGREDAEPRGHLGKGEKGAGQRGGAWDVHRFFMDFHRFFMDFHGFFMIFHSFSWFFVDFYWISMDFQWISAFSKASRAA